MPDPVARPRGSSLPDGWRLAFGTLTAVPVRPPARVDRATFGVAMLLAPATAVPALAGWVALGLAVSWGPLPALVAAVLAVAVTALVSRALHLDGLADLADGLTASHDPSRSLEVMRRGDTGPAGAATLVIVLMLQTACLAMLFADATGIALAGAALLGSRVAPALCARDGIPAARPEGLGQSVAGTVSGRASVALVAAVCLLGVLGCWVAPLAAGPTARWVGAVGGVAVVLAAASGAVAVRRRAVTRLGGITGDVIGASVEIALTVALVTATVVDGLWGH